METPASFQELYLSALRQEHLHAPVYGTCLHGWGCLWYTRIGYPQPASIRLGAIMGNPLRQQGGRRARYHEYAFQPNTISKPETLAFLFASMFNVPCVFAMGTTYREASSVKWLCTIAGYYLLISLTLAFIGYHIGLLIF